MTFDPEIEARIRDAPLSAHLATSNDHRPHVAPVWYGYREGTLHVLTGGKKLENARRNPRVAVSIEQTDGRGGVEWGVTMLGRAAVVDDVERIADAQSWIFDPYTDASTDAEADGDGEVSEVPYQAEDTGDEEPEVGEPGVDYALLEIEIGSATLQTY